MKKREGGEKKRREEGERKRKEERERREEKREKDVSRATNMLSLIKFELPGPRVPTTARNRDG